MRSGGIRAIHYQTEMVLMRATNLEFATFPAITYDTLLETVHYFSDTIILS